MEIIKLESSEKDIDEMAKKVFLEAIELLGGLKKLIEYRNLTWLPSLANAAYAVVLKNEAFLTNSEIAAKLGLTKQTVERILESREEEVEKFIKRELEHIDEHRAGGLAKLAYKKLKSEGFESVELTKAHAEEIEKGLQINFVWAALVLMKIKGLDFPVEKENLKERLKGFTLKGKPIEEILEKIEYPIRSPAELLKKIKQSIQD